MRRKDNLCLWRRHEHQQDQTEKKISSFKKNLLQYLLNENVLHTPSDNFYYNHIRRVFT